jgi:hypothetical protein
VTLDKLKILAVIPTLPEDLQISTIKSLLNQTVLPRAILILPNRNAVGNSVAEKVANVLNQGQAPINLDAYDYVLRMDCDTVLPANFIEENLRDTPDLCGSAGHALLIKTSAWKKACGYRWNPVCEDGYLGYKFRMLGLKVTKLKVKTLDVSIGGSGHSTQYFFYRGFAWHMLGYEPLHALFGFTWGLRNVFATCAYFVALLVRWPRLDVADFTFKTQVRRLKVHV